MQESRLQQACVRWFAYLPGIDQRFLVAVPNEGRRSKATSGRMKAEGMVAGVSDLILFHPKAQRRPLFLECKLPKGRQSPSQKDFEAIYTAAGYQYRVFRSFEDFAHLVCEYLGLEVRKYL